MSKEEKNILLVEDEMIIAIAESDTIRNFGYQVVTASSGKKAVEMALNTNGISLILMDIDLGKGIDGTEAARQILAKRNIPIVFLTSHYEREMVEKVRGITRYGYVIKNSGDFVLQSSIEMAFELFEANKKLRESEESLAITLQSIGDCVISTDIDGFITRMNKEAERLTGWNFQEAQNKPLTDVFKIINAETRQLIQSPVAKVLKTGKVIGLANHTILVSKDGTEYQIADSAAPIKDTHGIVHGVILVFSDVTERYRAQAALKESEHRFRAFMDNIPALAWVKDEAGRYLYMNRQYEKFVGVRLEQYRGKKDSDFVPFDVASTFREKDINALNSSKPIEFIEEMRDKNGDLRTTWKIKFVFQDSSGKKFVGGIGLDMTDMKKMEEALRESETRWQFALEGGEHGLWDWNAQTNKVFFSKQWKSMLGFEENEIGDSLEEWSKRVHPEDLDRVYADIQKHFDGKCPVYLSEYRILCKDGSYKWILDRGKIISHTKDGKPLRVIGTHTDITNLKQVKKALEESEKRCTLMLHAIPDQVFRMNREGVFLDYKADIKDLYVRSKAIIGQKNRDLTPPALADLIDRQIQTTLKTGQIQTFEYRLDIPMKGLRDYEARMIPSSDEVIVIVRDITERKKTEERIRTLVKEKELLLKEVHHRIKNNMNTILSLLSMHSAKQRNVEAIVALQEAQSCVKSMMVLYDKLYRSTDYKRISIREYLSPLIDEIMSIFPNRNLVKVEKRMDDFILDTKTLFPLGIIVNELLTNAMKHAFCNKNDGLMQVSVSRMDQQASIVVQDNGCGLPDSFNIESSAGFGLQLVVWLTEQIGGTLQIKHEKGTKFILELTPE